MSIAALLFNKRASSLTASYNDTANAEAVENVLIVTIIMIGICIVISLLLALIPAKIAQNKGYRGGLWWLYGLFLFWIALIHSLCIENKNAKRVIPSTPTKRVVSPTSQSDANVKKLKQYKELLDSGVITQAEFDQKKKELIDL